MTHDMMLQWAKWYHERGLHPMPIEKHGKRPLLSSWKEYFSRQPTVAELESWWADNPGANIALIMGRGMFALDIDGPEGEAALVALGIQIPRDAPVSKTSKGRHVLMLADSIPNAVNLLPKLDIRGDGGYIVVPPSIHESGHTYQWLNDLWPPPPAPPRLVELIRKPPREVAVKQFDSWLVDALDGVGEGERNSMCAKIAGYLWGKGLPEDVVERLMQMWRDTLPDGTDPFPPGEVTRTVQSICKREGGPEGPPAPISGVVDDVLASIFAPKELRPPVVPTGIPSVDEALDGGFFPADYILLAARPSVGKSAWASQLTLDYSARGKGVLYVSLEMSKGVLVRRMLVQLSKVSAKMLKTGEFPEGPVGEGFKELLRKAALELRDRPIWIATDLYSGEDIADALSKFEPGQLAMVVVDYLQIMSSEHRDTRARVEHCSKMLKRAAVKYNVPILTISSLSRPPRDSENWRPQLSDLRESGELEHDADTVIMMHRDLDSPDAEIFVRKQRDGAAGGKIYATFDGSTQTLTEVGR